MRTNPFSNHTVHVHQEFRGIDSCEQALRDKVSRSRGEYNDRGEREIESEGENDVTRVALVSVPSKVETD